MSFKKILLDGDTVTPSVHALGGDKHSEATLAELNAKITGGNLDFDSAPRDPNVHVISHKIGGGDELDLDELGAPIGPVALNAQKITGLAAGTVAGDAVALDVNLRAPDATLLEGSTKAEVQDHTPKAHLLGSHTEDSLANLNAKITEGSLDLTTATRDPNVHAGNHKSGQSDELDLDELGVPTGNVDFAKKQATGMALDVQATAPVTPVEGQIYFNSADDHPYIYVPV